MIGNYKLNDIIKYDYEGNIFIGIIQNMLGSNTLEGKDIILLSINNSDDSYQDLDRWDLDLLNNRENEILGNMTEEEFRKQYAEYFV